MYKPFKDFYHLEIEKELNEYEINHILFTVGEYVRLNDIATPLINRMNDWFVGSPERTNLIEHNENDYKSIYYGRLETEKSERTAIVYFENCSKLFSKSVFKINKIFFNSKNVYLQLENFLIVKLDEDQIQISLHSKNLNKSEQFIYNCDKRALKDILERYNTAFELDTIKMFVLTERDVKNMVYAEYFPNYYRVIKEKWK